MAKVDTNKLLLRAKEALDRHNYDLAIFNYMQAITLDPKNLDAREKLRATQNRRAAEMGNNYVKMVPAVAQGMILALLGKHEQAVLAFENALVYLPTSAFVMKNLAKSAAEADFTEVAAWQRQVVADRYAQEDIDNLWELADLYKDLGRGEEAIACYDRIEELDPDEDVDGPRRDASAITSSEHFAKAVEEGARSILKDDEEAEILEMDAGKLRTDEQRLKVIDYLKKNDMAERPEDSRVYGRIGDIYYQLEDFATGYKEAKEFYQKAMELNASDSTLRDRLGDLEIKALRLKLDQLQAKLKANPQDKEVKKQLREWKKRRVDFETREYERRVKDQPLKAEFHFRLGELYFMVKRFDEAIEELQRASKDPKFKIRAQTILGRSFMALEQYDMAISRFQSAQEGEELFQKIREPIYFEAEAHEKVGTLDSLEKALALYTNIYQQDIGFMDVKTKVPELQKKVKEAKAAEPS